MKTLQPVDDWQVSSDCFITCFAWFYILYDDCWYFAFLLIICIHNVNDTILIHIFHMCSKIKLVKRINLNLVGNDVIYMHVDAYN